MDYLSPRSFWHKSTKTDSLQYPPLEGHRDVDVVIVGAGITGLTAGLHLKREGFRVAILEAGRVAAGATGGTSGHLDVHPDQGAAKLLRDFGESSARLVTHARMDAINQIESWCAELAIDCDFRRVPAFLFSETAEGAQSLRKQLDDVRRLGIDAEWVDETMLPFAHPGAIRIAQQARFHAVRYLAALARAFHGAGCSLHEHSRAHTPEDGNPCRVKTDRGSVTARHVLLCTHASFFGKSSVDVRIAPYNSYVMAARVAQEIPDGLFWDDQHPYHYIRRASSEDGKHVIIGGEDHKTGERGDESEHARKLRDYAAGRFRVIAVEAEWSSEFFEPADGVPFIGRYPSAEHVSFAGGFSGTGLTYGTLAGRLLAEQCRQQPSELAELFSLTRIKPLAAAKQMLTENADAAWRFVADRLAPETVTSLNEIPIGVGRVVSYRDKTLAVFRDGQGTTHLFSPQCTHAGCIVQWNEAASTWDCPCHGGRYAATGERLYGPPADDLARAKAPGE